MRIACTIGVRMVYAVRHDPLDWSTLQCEGSASHEEILDKFRDLVAPVSDQPMVAHANPQTAADPIKQNRGNHRRPAPEK